MSSADILLCDLTGAQVLANQGSEPLLDAPDGSEDELEKDWLDAIHSRYGGEPPGPSGPSGPSSSSQTKAKAKAKVSTSGKRKRETDTGDANVASDPVFLQRQQGVQKASAGDEPVKVYIDPNKNNRVIAEFADGKLKALGTFEQYYLETNSDFVWCRYSMMRFE